MSSTKENACKAAGRSCGTPAGWRYGGRCIRCRLAHNDETGRYRGLKDDERTAFLAALNGGRSLEGAAAHAGVSLAKLVGAAVRDNELRAALDGKPPATQKAARMGGYLAALTRTGGSVHLACLIAGVSEGRLIDYREQEPAFAAAEAAVMNWLRSAQATAVHELSDNRLDEAARLLERGDSPTKAALAINTSVGALRYAALRHPRLAAALPDKADRGDSRNRLTPEAENLLRELWPDLTLTQRDIAVRLDVTQGTISRWARELGLPVRPPRADRPKGDAVPGDAPARAGQLNEVRP